MAINLSKFFPQSAPVMPASYMTMDQWLQTPEGQAAAEGRQAVYDSKDMNRDGAADAYGEFLQTQYGRDFGLRPGSIGRPAAGVNPNTDQRKLLTISGADEFLTKIVNNTNPDFPTLSMTPERKQQILQQIAQSPEQQPNYLQFLTPEEMQPVQTWLTYEAQNRGHDGMAKALMAAGLAGFGALAGPSLLGGEAAGGATGASTLPESYWSTMAEGGGTLSDAAAANAGTMGADALTLGGQAPWWETAAGGTAAGSGAGGAAMGLAEGLGGAAPWWEAPAAAQAAGAAGGGAFNVADYVKNGFPGGSTPAIPGAGNGVGLTEAAMAGLGGAGATAGGSALSRLTGIDPDLTSLLGTAGSVGLGMYGADKQADAYGDLAGKYLDMGKPYRDMLLQTYQPNYSIANSPDFKNALDVGAQAAARATSAKYGNPVDNPGAYAEMQKFITGSLALPQLNTQRSQLGTFGQLGVNQAGTSQNNQVQSQGGIYNALGFGLGQLTQPDNPLKGLLSGLKLNNGFGL